MQDSPPSISSPDSSVLGPPLLSSQSPPPGTRIEALMGGTAGPGAPPIEELLLLLHREIARSRDPQQATELRARAALLTWDGRGEAEAAMRLCAGVNHPVATALRLHAAIDAPESAALLAYADEVQRRGNLEEVAEVGELLLWRGEYVRAAVLLERSGERDRQVRALALSLAGRYAEAVEVLSASSEPQALLLSAHILEDRLSDPERARTVLRRVLDKAKAGEVRELARALERLFELESRRPAEAGRVDLLRRKLELFGGVKVIETAEDNPARGVEAVGTAMLLSQSLERLGTPAAFTEAATLLSAIGRFCEVHRDQAAEVGHNLALRARARIESAQGNFEAAAATWAELGRRAETKAGEPDPVARAFGAAYKRRAAEIADIHGAGVATGGLARTLYRELFVTDPTDGVLALTLARVLLQGGDAAEAAQVLDQHARALPESSTAEQLRAARAAEAVRDPRRVERWLDIVTGERTALEALLRLHRRRADRPRLCATYRRIAVLSSQAAMGEDGAEGAPREPIEARRAAAYLSAAAALSLEALPTREAEVLIGEADRDVDAPGGLLVLFCRALLLRKLGRHAEFGAALLLLLRRVGDQDTQADLHRQLARIAVEHLGDAELAQKSYRRVLELRPGDVVALHAMARLQGESRPDQSVQLLRQAVEGALRIPVSLPDESDDLDEKAGRSPSGEVGPQAAALLLCELGALYERPGPARDEALALSTYQEALRLDPRCRTAVRALVALHRAARRLPELLDALALYVPLCRDDAERLPTLLSIGQTAEAQAGTDGSMPEGAALGAFAAGAAERAVEAYAGALAISPDNEVALSSLERLCRKLDRWSLLVELLDRAPRSSRGLRVLAEASERLSRWQDVARYREEELGLLSEPRELLRSARALAELYENRLHDPEAAARVWERAYAAADLPIAVAAGAVPDAPSAPAPVSSSSSGGFLGMGAAPAALERLYTVSERWDDLVRLFTREIARADLALAALGAAPSGDEGARNEDRSDEKEGLLVRRRDLLLQLGAAQRDHLHAPELAAATFERVLHDWPEETQALSSLAGLYAQQERPEELRRVLDVRARSTEDPVERSRVLLQAGELCEKRGELEEAQKAFGEAFALDPSSRSAFTSLERISYRREQWDDVLAMYDTALQLVEQHKSRAYRLGDLYSRRGQVLLQYLQRPKDAAADYLKALEFDPENDAIQGALERIHAAATDWAGLIAAYERRATLQKDDGKRVEVLRRAARVAAAKLRDIPEAIRLYQKLYSVDPTDSEALDALERHYDRSRDYEKLLSLLCTRLALATTEGESIALNLRIALLCEEGLRDHDRAIEAYRQVLEMQPSHREALDAMARLFEANERWAELIEVTRRQIRLIGDRTQKALLYFKCGSVMEAKFGKEDDAIRYYEGAVKTSPSCLPAVHGLRDIYLRRQDWPKVTQTLELEAKLWTEDKERAGVYAHIGQIYLDKLHDLDRAIEYYESALQVDKECLPANRALFEVFYERGDWARAVPMGQVLSAKVNREGEPRERSEFYRKRAVVADHAGDLRTAAESLVVALEIQPDHMEALELLVHLCRRDPSIYDFAATFRELEKLYRRRDARQGLGLVLVARAVLAERNYEVENAEEFLAEATRLSPGDYAVTEACVTLNEKLRRLHLSKAALDIFIEFKEKGERTPQTEADRARARLRLAEMYSEVAMDPEAAVAVLRTLLAPADGTPVPPPPADLLRIARFRLTQELYLLGRYPEALTEMEGLIELAVSPPDAGVAGAGTGSTAPPEELARYYDYLGRIQESQGDGAAAQRNYRRAVDLDPAFSLPVLALARRAATAGASPGAAGPAGAGDRAHAEALIRDALQQAKERGDPQEELRLRRGVARLLSQVDPAQAVAAYREAIAFATGLLDPDAEKAIHAAADLQGDRHGLVARETLDDRVALSDLLLQQEGGPARARDELLLVLQRDLRHAAAYRLLAQAYERLGEHDRAQRVLAALSLLGYAEVSGEIRTPFRPSLRRGAISEELRQGKLLLPALVSPYMELLQAIGESLSAVFPPPWPPPEGGPGMPASKVADAAFKVAMVDVQRLYGVDAEILVARGVPGTVLPIESLAARPAVIIEAGLLDRADAERRFLLGRAIDPLRGGYAILLRLRQAEAQQVMKLLDGLLLPEGERDEVAQEFARSLPRKAARVVDRLAAAAAAGARPAVSVETFFQALPLCADRAGLLACDDISAAVRMMARLQGEELALIDGGGGPGGVGVLLGQVAGGAELVRYFLSDAYQELRGSLKDPQS